MRAPKPLFFVTENWYFVSPWLPLAMAARQAGCEVPAVTRVGKHGHTVRNAGLRLIPVELSRRGKNPKSLFITDSVDGLIPG